MLHFNGIEPIDFGGRLYEPHLDAEKKLRLSEISYATDAEASQSDATLASCFFEPEAGEFIRTRLSNDDKIVLATYLNSGETGLNRLSKATDGAIEKYIERAVNNGNGQ